MTGIDFFEDYEEELRGEHGEPGERIFTVSGLTGTGTSTIAAFLAEEYGLDHVDAGDFFRGKAEEYGMSIEEFDSEASRIEEEEDVDFDVQWDRTVLRYAFTRDDIVLEGRLTGAVLQDLATVRVWVECDTRTVAERLKEDTREDKAESIGGQTVEDIEEYVRRRNGKQLERYREKYGVDPTDRDFYNVVIDNSQSLQQVKAELKGKVEEVLR
ncbi:MAG: cytidylate kinase family protein [Candidatus Nanohaloarchaea archaeon]